MLPLKKNPLYREKDPPFSDEKETITPTTPATTALSPAPPKRFLNGWSAENERLMAEWSDISMCYRWIHDQSEKIFHSKSLWINLPVIILTTLGGTANFGVQSLFDSETTKKYASFAIGGISLLSGILTTIGNYLRYAQLEESHRVASVSWGKFQRLIAIELALHPNDRMDSMDFLKICRAELDRLIEQSPPIPKEAIQKFSMKFGSIQKLKKPDICGELVHTHIYESSELRLKQLAVDAALMLKHKKNALKEMWEPQMQNMIRNEVKQRVADAIHSSMTSTASIPSVPEAPVPAVPIPSIPEAPVPAVSIPSIPEAPVPAVPVPAVPVPAVPVLRNVIVIPRSEQDKEV